MDPIRHFQTSPSHLLQLCWVFGFSLRPILYSWAGTRARIGDRGAHGADLPDPGQCGIAGGCATRNRLGSPIADLSRGQPPIWPAGRRIRPPASSVEGCRVDTSAVPTAFRPCLCEIHEMCGAGSSTPRRRFARHEGPPGGSVCRRKAEIRQAKPWQAGRYLQTELPLSAEKAAKTRAATQPPGDRPTRLHPSAGDASSFPRQSQILAAVIIAVDETGSTLFCRSEVYALPQRKVRFYEAVTRLRDDKDQVLSSVISSPVAEAAGLLGAESTTCGCCARAGAAPADGAQQGRRRGFLQRRGRTLGNPRTFAQCRDFLEANRAPLAPRWWLEFSQQLFASRP